MHATQTIIIIITLRDHAIFMDNNVGGLDVAVALFHINEVTPHSTRLVLG